MRQALCDKAQAMKLLPTPQGPVISTLSLSLIHWPEVNALITDLSSPRGTLKSIFSTQASCLSLACLNREVKRRFSCSVNSLSIKSPSRSSKPKAVYCSSLDCSCNVLSIPCNRSVRSLSLVGSDNILIPPVVGDL